MSIQEKGKDCRALIIDKGSQAVRAGSENATSETIIDRGTGKAVRTDKIGIGTTYTVVSRTSEEKR